METLQTLRKRIDTAENLRSVVRTMKSLAAVSIRQYERAARSLAEYDRTVELGLQVVLRARPPRRPRDENIRGRTGVVLFGSDHGLCGRFNEQVAGFALRRLADTALEPERRLVLVLGTRAAARLESSGIRVDAFDVLPGAVEGLTATAHNVFLQIRAWQEDRELERVLLFHNRRRGQAAAEPRARQLLPVNPSHLRALAARPWPSRRLPTFTMAPEILLTSLVRQHLFVSVYRAGAESMAAEHATRLASMQAAERNIGDHLEEMNGRYRRLRQQSITEELLDILSGFEALAEKAEGSEAGQPEVRNER